MMTIRPVLAASAQTVLNNFAVVQDGQNIGDRNAAFQHPLRGVLPDVEREQCAARQCATIAVPMQCRACVAEISGTSRFCPTCGAAVASSDAATASTAATPEPPGTTSPGPEPGLPGRPASPGRSAPPRRPWEQCRQRRPAGQSGLRVLPVPHPPTPSIRPASSPAPCSLAATASSRS
jgi:hypothetical protein